MAYLAENVSIEEIENELAFYEAVIKSLDPSEDDYGATIQRHHRTVAALEGLWFSKQPQEQPSSLESESEPADVSQQPKEHTKSISLDCSPLSIRSRQMTAETCSTGPKKRAYQEEHQPRKSHWPSSGVSPAYSSRNSSEDSLEQIVPPPKRDFKNRFLERQLEAERRAKERRDRERLDAELARSLAETADEPRASQGMSQSYLNSNGGLRTMTRATPAPEAPESVHLTQIDEWPRPPDVKKEMMPGTWTFPTNRVFDDTGSPDSSGDSLQEITSADFYAFGSSSAAPTTNSRNAISNRHHFQADPQTAAQPSSDFLLQAPQTWPSQYQIPASTLPQYSVGDFPASHPWLPNGTGSAQPNGSMTASIWNATGVSSGAASSSWENRNSFDVDAPIFTGSRTIKSNMFDALGFPFVQPSYHTSGRRDLDYLYNDPSKSKEEIDELLSNIRPDEDLPAHMRGNTPAQMKVTLMEHQKLGLTWLQQQEDGSNKGSILADDMGLGKTIQALALMVTRQSEDPTQKTNLIIAPVALLRQWAKEIEEKLVRSARLKVYIYHGPKKAKATWAFLSGFDVVLTTYGSVASEYRKINDWKARHKDTQFDSHVANRLGLVLILENARWYRIILDEAQYIKNLNTKTSLAVLHLHGKFRLCMTGTPMMNHVGELYPLIRFLRISPFNQMEKFNSAFQRPLTGNGTSQRDRTKAMRALQALLKAILLRRNKKSTIDGKPILDLKPRTIEVKHAIFSPDEQEFYKHLELRTQLQVNKYLKAKTVGRNYSNILVLLLRLRQACCHPHLIKDHGVTVDADITTEQMEELCTSLADDVVKRIKDANGSFECPICYDAVESPAILYPCGHDICSECFSRMTDSSTAIARGAETADAKCPECRGAVNRKKIIDYSIFEKVHLPEVWQQKHSDVNEEDGKSDVESETDSESDSDTSSQGNLDDFIVDDDVEIEYEKDANDDMVMKSESDEDGVVDKRRRKSRNSLKVEDDLDVKDESDIEGTKKPRVFKKKKTKSSRRGRKLKEPKMTLAVLKKESLRNQKAKRRYLRRLRRDWIGSAKIDKTMEILKDIRTNDPTEKTIVFSQFTSLLDLLEIPIDDQGWKFQRYDGSMSADMRNNAVEAFSENPDCKIILVSLKAGNAGLNLTSASQVIILDPFWNPFIEEQAIDRAHRIGQRRSVFIHRILIENTVEDRIITLQEKKRDFIDRALDEKAGKSLSRLGLTELRYLFAIDSRLE